MSTQTNDPFADLFESVGLSGNTTAAIAEPEETERQTTPAPTTTRATQQSEADDPFAELFNSAGLGETSTTPEPEPEPVEEEVSQQRPGLLQKGIDFVGGLFGGKEEQVEPIDQQTKVGDAGPEIPGRLLTSEQEVDRGVIYDTAKSVQDGISGVGKEILDADRRAGQSILNAFTAPVRAVDEAIQTAGVIQGLRGGQAEYRPEAEGPAIPSRYMTGERQGLLQGTMGKEWTEEELQILDEVVSDRPVSSTVENFNNSGMGKWVKENEETIASVMHVALMLQGAGVTPESIKRTVTNLNSPQKIANALKGFRSDVRTDVFLKTQAVKSLPSDVQRNIKSLPVAVRGNVYSALGKPDLNLKPEDINAYVKSYKIWLRQGGVGNPPQMQKLVPHKGDQYYTEFKGGETQAVKINPKVISNSLRGRVRTGSAQTPPPGQAAPQNDPTSSMGAVVKTGNQSQVQPLSKNDPFLPLMKSVGLEPTNAVERAVPGIAPQQPEVIANTGNIDTPTQFGTVKVDPLQIDHLSKLPGNSITKGHVEALPDRHVTLSIDGDNFKAVNDSFGHKEGDRVIAAIGEKLNKHFPEYFRGREGGEEFLVDFGDVEITKDLTDRVLAFHSDIAETLKVGPDSEPFTLSIGLGRGKNANESLVSDNASYLAKEGGRNQLVVDNDGKIDYYKGEGVGPKRYVSDFSRKQASDAITVLEKDGDLDPAEAQRIREVINGRKDGKKESGSGLPETESLRTEVTPTKQTELKGFEDTRTQTQKDIESVQREKKESLKAQERVSPGEDTPLFDKNVQEQRATVQEDAFAQTAKQVPKSTDNATSSWTRDQVLETIDMHNSVYQKIKKEALKLGIIDDETNLGGYIQEGDGQGLSYAAGPLYFRADGTITLITNGATVSFDKKGNVLSASLPKGVTTKDRIESIKETIDIVDRKLHGDEINYKVVNELDYLGEPTGRKIKKKLSPEQIESKRQDLIQQKQILQKELGELSGSKTGSPKSTDGQKVMDWADKYSSKKLPADKVSPMETTREHLTDFDTRDAKFSDTFNKLSPAEQQKTIRTMGQEVKARVSDIEGILKAENITAPSSSTIGKNLNMLKRLNRVLAKKSKDIGQEPELKAQRESTEIRRMSAREKSYVEKGDTSTKEYQELHSTATEVLKDVTPEGMQRFFNDKGLSYQKPQLQKAIQNVVAGKQGGEIEREIRKAIDNDFRGMGLGYVHEDRIAAIVNTGVDPMTSAAKNILDNNLNTIDKEGFDWSLGELVKTGTTTKASIGDFATTETLEKVATKKVSPIAGIELPEAVELYREATGGKNMKLLEVLSVANARGLAKGDRIEMLASLVKDPEQFLKTFQHEIGHVISYVPDKLKRGNALGHMASLHKNLKHWYEGYSLKEIKKELWGLSQDWRPLGANPSEKYLKYRKSADELYADAISVLLNDPELLQEMAPKFYEGLFKYLDRKPDVLKAYNNIQERISRGREAVLDASMERTKEGFRRKAEADAVKKVERKKEMDVAKGTLIHGIKEIFFSKAVRLQEMDKVTGATEKTSAYQRFRDLPFVESMGDVYSADVAYRIQEALYTSADGKMTKPTDAVITKDKENLNLYVFLRRAGLGDRKDLISTGGVGGQRAVDELARLKENVGEEQFAKYKKAAEGLYDARQEYIIPLFKESGAFSDAFIKNAESNYDYAHFDVLIENFNKEHGSTATASIFGLKPKHQVGTTRDIAELVKATVIDDMRMIRGLAYITLNKTTIETLLKNYDLLGYKIEPTKVARATGTIIKDGKKVRVVKKRFIPVSTKDMQTVYYFEKGELKAYDVDRRIAKLLETKPEEANRFVDVIRKVDGTLKKVLIQLNLAFQAKNPVRDSKASAINNEGLRFIDTVQRTIKTIPEVFEYLTTGKISPDLKEAMWSKAIPSSAGGSLAKWRSPDDVEMLEAINKRLGVSPEQDEKILSNIAKGIDRFFGGLPAGSKALGIANWYDDKTSLALQVQEMSQKLMGWKYLKEKHPDWSIERRAHQVRTAFGTPDTQYGGSAAPALNVLLTFFTAKVNGLQVTANAVKKDPLGTSEKLFTYEILPKIPGVLAKAGLLGSALAAIGFREDIAEWWEDSYKRIPSYYLSRYHTFPLPIRTKSGRQGFITIPSDHNAQWFGAATYEMLVAIADEEKSVLQGTQRAAKEVSATNPIGYASTSPLIQVMAASGDWAVGGDPNDFWRNNKIIPRSIKGTGTLEEAKSMAKWSYGKVGGGTFLKIDDRDVDPEDKHWIEKLLKLPIVGPPMSSYIRFSDAGLREVARDAQTGDQNQRKKELRQIDEVIREDVKASEKFDRRAVRNLYRKAENEGLNPGRAYAFQDRYIKDYVNYFGEAELKRINNAATIAERERAIEAYLDANKLSGSERARTKKQLGSRRRLPGFVKR